jgi:Hint domain
MSKGRTSTWAETQIEKLRFARRHLYLLAAVGVAAVLTRSKSAQAFTCTTASAVTPTNPEGLNPTFAGDPDCAYYEETEEFVAKYGGPGSPPPHCFLKGTRIITRDGERPIEELAVGDLVLVRNRGFRPVEDIIHQDIAEPPVRIARGALAGGVPSADLYVSKRHGILVNGALVTAMSLVNGRTITYAYDVTETAHFHIELDHHGIVYAHGAPCESYVEEGAEEMPVLGHGGGLSRMRSHFRSALSPWIDWREASDLIRDGLDSKNTRTISPLRQASSK